MNLSQSTLVQDESAIGEARRKAQAVSDGLGFSSEDQGRVAIIATELASNLIVHAKRGQMLIQPVSDLTSPSVELVAIDKGIGMADIAQCLRDGYSTQGTAGNGLGAVRRLSTDFDLYSKPGLGTAVYSRVAAARVQETPGIFRVGGVCVPMKGENVSGDGWRAVSLGPARLRVVVVDGL